MMHIFHKYKVVSSDIGEGVSTDSLTLVKTERIPMTTILYKCEVCGMFKVRNIEGKWSHDVLTEQK